jgi:hypothetical protein
MSVLDALDATRICARSSAALADPAAWSRVPTTPNRRPAAITAPTSYSWWSLVSNPQALLVTGMIGTMVAKDFAAHILAGAGSRQPMRG